MSDVNQYVQEGLTAWWPKRPVDDTLSLCEIIQRGIDAMYASVKAEPEVIFGLAVNELLHETLQTLDYYSYVPGVGGYSSPDFVLTGKSAPVPLLSRSDYIWRKPMALVVDPSYNGNLNQMITPWSIITQVQGYAIRAHSFFETQAFMEFGAPDQSLTLSMISSVTGEPMTISVPTVDTEREDLSGVSSHIVDGRILYIRIQNISEKTKDQIIQDFYKAVSQVSSLDGMILDLTGNVGGDSEFAEKIASVFLPFGSTIMAELSTELLPNLQKQPVIDIRKHQFPNLESIAPASLPPTMVLTNRRTASSGEIIVAAWKANKLPIIHVGESTTFGKGSGMRSVAYPNDPYIKKFTVTSLGAFAFSQDESGQTSWRSWQLHPDGQTYGLTPDVIIQDPVIEHLYKNPEARDFDRSFDMADLASRADQDIVRLSIPPLMPEETPEILVPEANQKDPDTVLMLQELAKELNIQACNKDAVPGSSLFQEHKECLYLASIALMRAWLSNV